MRNNTAEIVVIIIFYLALGLLAGWIYKRKGRSFFVGLMGVLFFGAFGFALVMVSGETKELKERKNFEEIQRKLQTGELRYCQYCGWIVDSRYPYCVHCGK